MQTWSSSWKSEGARCWASRWSQLGLPAGVQAIEHSRNEQAASVRRQMYGPVQLVSHTRQSRGNNALGC